MRVRVELSEQQDARAHAREHAADRLPDRTPYGLHRVATGDVDVVFRPPLPPAARTLSRVVRNRLGGYDVVGATAGALDRDRARADVVLCMDERAGFPAALGPGPPVVSHLIWVGRPDSYGRARRAVVHRALDRLAGAFTTTPSLRDDLLAAWDLDPSRVVAVRPGIDTGFFPPQPFPTSTDETSPDPTPVVVSAGDDRFRDHGTLVAALDGLRRRGLPVRLELATTLADAQVPAGLGVLHRRRMEGGMRALYRRASVVAVALQPTTRGSGTSVVLEAAASARPVVATRTPAMAALVADGERGLLVEPGDPTAFGDAVAALLADPDRARRMGAAARTWVEGAHTSAHMADDVRRVLRGALRPS
ncbi:glycosyltransferase family 4 protein [Actinomycetospora sp. NBRC 106378]|uniref:glycosyltransferase family 4 protein n=1 Tax=Actinomycetospora sp. NBRC 106378 TaxID=3032208 RepID=UPI0024A4AFBA|nr:glycosyltransferase family 4 protein [Actinomycetospora sp. NBRC 106378]GLZ54466.1 hypothetical protein Acsp07_40830 [Actinomycetospora sp. NBRC 106378]